MFVLIIGLVSTTGVRHSATCLIEFDSVNALTNCELSSKMYCLSSLALKNRALLTADRKL